MSLSQRMLSCSWSQLFGGLLVVFLICAGGEDRVNAQSAWETEESDPWERHVSLDRDNASPEDSGASGGVPDWAAPHETPTGPWTPDASNPTEPESGYDIPRWNDAERRGDGAEMNGVDMPNDPNKIPVDGGLGLLLVAGAGYAAHRLRKKEDDTDADDAPLP